MISFAFIEDLGVEEACHGELRKDQEAESTQHRPSASFLVHPKLFKFFRLWLLVLKVFPILNTLSLQSLIFFLLIRCREVIIALLNDISIWARDWTCVDKQLIDFIHFLSICHQINVWRVHVVYHLVRVSAQEVVGLEVIKPHCAVEVFSQRERGTNANSTIPWISILCLLEVGLTLLIQDFIY